MPLGSLLVHQFLLLIIFSVLGPNLPGLTTPKSNPIVLLILNVGLVVNAYFLMKENFKKNQAAVAAPMAVWERWWLVGMAVLPIVLAYEELRKLWVKFDPTKISDVIPLLRTLNDRFFGDEFPYQEIQFETHAVFPMYFPLHWMPIQLGNALGIDIRWIGILMLVISIGVAAYFLSKRVSHSSPKWVVAVGFWLITIPLWAFIIWGGIEISVSLETIIAAWYILLAAGLAGGDLRLIGFGLAGTLLSRYTNIFWVPCFAMLLWLNFPKRVSYRLWLGVLVAMLLLYILPFFIQEPGILSAGLKYYDLCALNSWSREHDDDFRQGINFAIHFKRALGSTPESALFWMRVIQLLLMAALCVGGIFFYQKRGKNFVSFFDFALLQLQLAISLFYLSSPMTFQYYLLVPLMTGAILVWKSLFGVAKMDAA